MNHSLCLLSAVFFNVISLVAASWGLSRCDSEFEGCHVLNIKCTGGDSITMKDLGDSFGKHECLQRPRDCCINNHEYYSFEYYGHDMRISIDINKNLDAFWESDYSLDSSIKTIKIREIENVPTKLQEFKNIEVIEFIDCKLQDFDMSIFKGLELLYKINASSNSIVSVKSNRGSEVSHVKTIDLSKNKITSLHDQCFSKFLELKYLNLSHNLIKNIEIITFEGLAQLEVLDLSFNNLIGIDHSVARFTNMKKMYINNNLLNSIDESNFKFLSNLKILHLGNNLIRTIHDDAFQKLTELKELDLSNNNINTDLKNILKNLVLLEELKLSHNEITNLDPQTFLQLNKLINLDIGHNKINNSITGNYFQGLSDVQNIELSQNSFVSIEDEAFNGLNKLLKINFSYCKIKSVGFNAFKNTSSIQVIDLSNNLLQNFNILPESISTVKELLLNNNNIQSFPKETFASLTNIEKCYLGKNELLEIEPGFFTSAKKMLYLDLSYTKVDIETVLRSFDTLSELSIAHTRDHINFENIVNKTIFNLDMSFNNIENINLVYIFKIQNVTRLNLRNNNITFIDKLSFQSIPTLSVLDLSFNLISQIQPGSFLHTNNIEDLNLHSNSLADLEFGIFEGLKNLKTLNLSDNLINKFSASFLHSTPFLSKVILDNNRIKNINFNDFLGSHVRTISIGGNLLSCHLLANFKHYTSKNYPPDYILITAENLDYHSANYKGVKCVSDIDSNESISFPQLSNDVNGTMYFSLLAKELQNLRTAIENIVKKRDSKVVSENAAVVSNNVTDLLKSIETDVINNTNGTAHSLEKLTNKIILSLDKNTGLLMQSMKDLIRNVTSDRKIKYIHINDSNDHSILDNHLNEKLEIMNDEKERLVKELQSIFEELKSSSNIKTETQIYENGSDKINDLKGVLYFVSVCLTIIVIMFFSVLAYKIFKNRNVLQRNIMFNSSSQPIANEMELS